MVKRKAAKKAAKPTKKKAGTIADRKKPNGAPRSLLEDRKKAKKAKQARAPKGEQMELIKGVRYADLDRLCKQIGDNMDEINGLRDNDGSFRQAALRSMRIHNVTGYNYYGVTLVRNQGDETLSVKRDKKKQASEGAGALNQPADADTSTGSGQDVGAIGDALTEGAGEEM